MGPNGHVVNGVQELYDTAESLYNKVVLGDADTIIDELNQGITVLKNCWSGMDAGVQIQNVVQVHNAMVEIRNKLAELASNSSEVASLYRDIQISNRVTASALPKINTTTKNKIEDYSDERDIINITQEALSGKDKIDSAVGRIDEFSSQVNNHYSDIMNKWQAGTGRDKADQAFNDFMSKVKSYKETLNDVSVSIKDAISNYNM